MGIKFEHDGKVFEVDTPEQAVELLDLLERRAVAAARRAEYSTRLAGIVRNTLSAAPPALWNPTLFARFIARLGDRQKLILEFLMIRRTATDAELRSAAGAADNLALAGILSGISKQAIAENIPPRAVFSVKNLRVRGSRAGSRYVLSDAFWQIAREMDWPPALRAELFPELADPADGDRRE